MKKIITLLFLAAALVGSNLVQAQIQVLTGTEHGTYFQLAKDMNKLLPMTRVVKGQDTVDVSFLDIRSTAGSSLNFDLLSQKDHPAKAAFMQIDHLLLMKNEDIMNGTKLTDDIVILMPLNVEEIHLVSKKGSSINSLASLEGRNVVIGNKVEGTYSTATYIQNESKVSWHSKNISTQDVTKPLLLDKVDAFFVVASAPMVMLDVNPAISPVKFKLSPVEDINGWAEYFIPTTIPAGTYRWQKTDIATFGVPSVIVVNTAKLSAEEKQQLLQWKANTIENLETLKANGHAAWKTAIVKDGKKFHWPMLE